MFRLTDSLTSARTQSMWMWNWFWLRATAELIARLIQSRGMSVRARASTKLPACQAAAK